MPCDGSKTLHSAVYLRFTAPKDGWYALHAVPTGSLSWKPHVGVLPSCDVSVQATYGQTMIGYPLCDVPGYGQRDYASVSVYLLSGESRIIAVGGTTGNDFGSAEFRVVRIGDTLMDGAQELSLGSNSYTVAPLEPPVPYQGACTHWWADRMASASRFTFTPGKTGDYRFSFCESLRYEIALSDSPDMPYASLTTGGFGCPNVGGRLTASLTAGTTYYIAAGFYAGNFDACATRDVTVEYYDPCPADLNDDESTDGKDLAILISGWGTADADITGDSNTDGVDLGILLASWGPCTG